MTRSHSAAVGAFVAVLLALAGCFPAAQTPPDIAEGASGARARAERNGRVRVLVELNLAAGATSPRERFARRRTSLGSEARC